MTFGTLVHIRLKHKPRHLVWEREQCRAHHNLFSKATTTLDTATVRQCLGMCNLSCFRGVPFGEVSTCIQSAGVRLCPAEVVAGWVVIHECDPQASVVPGDTCFSPTQQLARFGPSLQDPPIRHWLQRKQ